MGIAQTFNLFELLNARIVSGILYTLLAPAHGHEALLTFLEILEGRVYNFGDGARAPDVAREDRRGVKAFRVLIFSNPGALGLVV